MRARRLRDLRCRCAPFAAVCAMQPSGTTARTRRPHRHVMNPQVEKNDYELAFLPLVLAPGTFGGIHTQGTTNLLFSIPHTKRRVLCSRRVVECNLHTQNLITSRSVI